MRIRIVCSLPRRMANTDADGDREGEADAGLYPARSSRDVTVGRRPAGLCGVALLESFLTLLI